MGREYAIYYYIELKLPEDMQVKISKALNIEEDILRYLLVKADPKFVKVEDERVNYQSY